MGSSDDISEVGVISVGVMRPKGEGGCGIVMYASDDIPELDDRLERTRRPTPYAGPSMDSSYVDFQF